MWIEAPNTSTRQLMRKILDDDGKVVDTFIANFNHNGRAEVTKRAGDFFLRDVPVLKTVRDGGPPPPEETDEAVTKETTDAE